MHQKCRNWNEYAYIIPIVILVMLVTTVVNM